jgi:hypothetical protein
MDEIAIREQEVEGITDRLLSSNAELVETEINEIREHIEQKPPLLPTSSFPTRPSPNRNFTCT